MSINAKFKADFAKFIQKAGENADLVVRKVAADLMAEVDLRSPVDEGRFRGNNNFALNRVDGKEYGDDKSGTGAIKRAQDALKSFKMGDTIYITNSLPYARVIEYGEYGDGPKTSGGFSIKAPRGVYGVTAQSFNAYLQTEIRKLPK